MISVENLEKELKTGKLNSIYFLYGEELFLLENTLKKIKNIFGECIKGINYINIDETNYNQLISDIETPAFGYEKKLIIARNTGLLKKEGKRIRAICKAYEVQIDSSTLKYFIECCGTNMQDLINEIRKLIEYVGKGGKITKEDIDKLSIKKLESVIFDLTDSLGKKETAKALQVLKNLIYAKEPLQKILITLYNHFKKLYFTKIALKNGKDIISSLNLKPNQTFLVNKYKMQAGYFKQEELKQILQKLRDVDYQYKNGLIDLQVGMESILCAYCSK